ncbi:hypothetical protein EYR41_001048 [Orbilia oligospora]|uniref:Uncharacterized protein n=1 Tax=Orbilia oligospora TaxID=2813651 RepID=A0A7C8K3E4_ORBOL|nr:hypothetical protein TWF751_003594 [Orbilia oligospora]TGJ73991.1 hypothetical protein EYR41_001048 [Orbilia oligospora]
MPGQIHKWPAWPEYGADNSTSQDQDFVNTKKAIVEEFGQENLQKAWIRVCEDLSSITDEIVEQGNKIIPICSAEQILENGFSSNDEERIKKTGCVIVRGVLPRTEAQELYTELHQYISDNQGTINAWPVETPSMYEIYDSPVQNTIRSHPRHLKLQKLLNGLWHDKSGETSSDPLIYYDGVRDRPPKQVFLGLGPHIDAGSLSRWAAPTYRKVYESIFSGRPENHDAWNLEVRKDAVQDLFKAPSHSSVFRAFQGWTALTPSKAREGSILLYPNVATTIGYMLLRPFFNPPENDADIMDASKWSFDESSCHFPGTEKDQSQFLSRSSHPHLRFEECMMHVPDIQPGDTVWWHSDLCHAVDPEHEGTQNSSVAFIAAVPTTPMTKVYIKQQLADVLVGSQPSDTQGKVNETLLKGYRGHENFSDDVRRAFGYYL